MLLLGSRESWLPAGTEENYDRSGTAFPAAQAARRGSVRRGNQLIPAAAGSRGQVAQDDRHVHRGGAVVRRGSSSAGDLPDVLGAGLRAGCPALDGLAAGQLQRLL